jgi:hypothetical protein
VLLPPVLLLLLLPQVLDLLNHINKRVKALPGTALPLLPLVRGAGGGELGVKGN